jgi:hypothetical protein
VEGRSPPASAPENAAKPPRQSESSDKGESFHALSPRIIGDWCGSHQMGLRPNFTDQKSTIGNHQSEVF